LEQAQVLVQEHFMPVLLLVEKLVVLENVDFIEMLEVLEILFMKMIIVILHHEVMQEKVRQVIFILSMQLIKRRLVLQVPPAFLPPLVLALPAILFLVHLPQNLPPVLVRLQVLFHYLLHLQVFPRLQVH